MPTITANRNRRAVWVNEDSYATTLLVMFIDQYGTEGLRWAPQTIEMEVNEDFDVKLSKFTFDKLMAAITVLTTDDFYINLPDFIMLCSVFSGTPSDPTVLTMIDAAEAAWGVTEGLLISPPDSDEPFSLEIRAFIGELVKREGIITPPDVLKLGLGDYQALVSQIQTGFTDDPTMFKAIYDLEQGKTDEINMLIRKNLKELLSQLSELKLNNGSTDDIAQKLLSSLS